MNKQLSLSSKNLLKPVNQIILDVDGVIVEKGAKKINLKVFSYIQKLNNNGYNIIINTLRGPETWQQLDKQTDMWFEKNSIVIYEFGSWAKRGNQAITFARKPTEIRKIANKMQKYIKTKRGLIEYKNKLISVGLWPYKTKVAKYFKLKSPCLSSSFLLGFTDMLNALFQTNSCAYIEPTFEGTIVVKDALYNKGTPLKKLHINLKSSLAIGNSFVDISMLEACAVGVTVNPNFKNNNIYTTNYQGIHGTIEVLQALAEMKKGEIL